jgi:hypothetical protein
LLSTIFDTSRQPGFPPWRCPNELAGLHADVRDRLLHGATIAGPALPAITDPVDLRALADQVTAAITAAPDAMIWAYVDLDRHVHRAASTSAPRPR